MREMRACAIAIVVLTAAVAGCGTAHHDQSPTVTTALAGGDPGTPVAPGLHVTTTTKTTSTPTRKTYVAFQMPSGRYACTVLDATLVCDFRRQSGDQGNPAPNVAMTAICRREASGEWGNGVSLTAHHPATPNCSTGVNVTDRSPPKLAYGSSWIRDGFTCRSTTKGLTCANGNGHGFFANKDTIRVH
jgi:hypothetical protein